MVRYRTCSGHASGLGGMVIERRRLLPNEARWQELIHEESDACFLDTAWGDKMQIRAWLIGTWLMRQSIGKSKRGGVNPAEKTAFLDPLDRALKADVWHE